MSAGRFVSDPDLKKGVYGESLSWITLYKLLPKALS